MKEIGGYIEFEHYRGHALHEELIGLNSGRSCLAYLIEAKHIRAIALPYFLCDSVKELCENKKIKTRYYRTGLSLHPEKLSLEPGEWLYAVNYYGQLTGEDILKLKSTYGRLILDNSQAYFDEPLPGVDTIYTCRKYFGVSDGAFLSTDTRLSRLIPEDTSGDRLAFLFGRFEGRASDYYDLYAANNHRFRSEPVKAISPLTLNFLRAVDYDEVRLRRRDNFAFLHDKLGKYNRLALSVPDGAFAYPLMVRNADKIRKKMIERKIYVPLLWPNVAEETDPSSVDYKLAVSVLPLPCDQRYDRDDMNMICSVFEEITGGEDNHGTYA